MLQIMPVSICPLGQPGRMRVKQLSGGLTGTGLSGNKREMGGDSKYLIYFGSVKQPKF